jgi:hypothetical protein
MVIATWVLVLFFWLGYGEHFVAQTEAYQNAPECLEASRTARETHTATRGHIHKVWATCHRLKTNPVPTHVKIFYWTHFPNPHREPYLQRRRVDATGYGSSQDCEADLTTTIDWWLSVRHDQHAARSISNMWGRCDRLIVGVRTGDRIPSRREVDRKREEVDRMRAIEALPEM